MIAMIPQKKIALYTFNLKHKAHSKNKQKKRGLFTTIVSTIILLLFTSNTFCQRHMEFLDRGLIAVNALDHVFLSWRMFSADNKNVSFNIYRNDTLVNQTPLTGKSNYTDTNGTENSIYFLETIYDIAKKDISTPVTVWKEQYLNIPLQPPGEKYYSNDASIADLDGDGEMEIIVKMQSSNPDNTSEVVTDPVFLQAYKLNGKLLWSINLGVNIRAGAHYTQLMAYDLNGDGLAEVACKTAPGTIDGKGNYLKKGPAAEDDDNANYVNSNGRILSGPEYLTVFNGLSGEEVSTVYYTPRRHPDTENPTGTQLNDVWGDSYGNRVDRFLAGIAYFDTIPSLVMCRGYYTRSVLAAWDFDGASLTQRWIFDSDDGYTDFGGQGNHNLTVADVDEDGKDEIIYGAMCVDDDGTGLWTTGFGHGDALHVGDIDPDRPGLEKWGITESPSTSGSQLLDASTGEVLWETPAGDIARGASADVSADFLGMECWGGTSGLRSAKNEYVGDAPASANFLIWWDGDLLRELLNGTEVSKYGIDEPVFSANGCISNNGTKSNPTISGDILGDWREEVIFRTEDNQSLRVYTTTIPTAYGFYTLLQDHQYRLSLAWQNVGYNQPPHTGFFLGDGMNMDAIPIPNSKVPQNGTPSIEIAFPKNSYELGLGLDLDIIVNTTGLSDADRSIIITNGSTPVDTILEAPNYITIPGLMTGNYSFLAKAYDINGSLMVSDTVFVTVDEGYPHISINSPSTGEIFTPEDPVLISANGYDTDGHIDSVIFYLENERLGTSLTAPYSITIDNPGVGIHNVFAQAFDNDGKYTNSDTVKVEVCKIDTIQENETGYCDIKNGNGWIEKNHTGYTGSGFVNTENITGVQIVWSVDVPETGTYRLDWRYASVDIRPAKLLINDVSVEEVPFGNTGGWNIWENAPAYVNLNAGINKISLEATSSKGISNLDCLILYSYNAGKKAIGADCSYFLSSDSTLKALSVTDVDISPVFSPTVYAYNISLDENTTLIQVNATPSNENAFVSGTGFVQVIPPSGSIDVVVTAENGTSTLTYMINYNHLLSKKDLTYDKFKVYPVPVIDYLNIEFFDSNESIDNISFYSLDGRKVYFNKRIKNRKTRIELTGIEKGVYLLEINTNLKNYCKIINVL
jgi:rhamnogalacturonan endolyase